MALRNRGRSARRRAGGHGIEALEPRALLTATLPAFATVQGALGAEGRASDTVHVNRDSFGTAASGRVGIRVNVGAGATVAALTGGQPGSTPKAKLDDGGMLAFVRPGTYSVAVAGASGAGYQTNFSLAGDVDGNGSVDRQDLRLIRSGVRNPGSLPGSQAGAADVNGDGRIGAADFQLATRNFRASTNLQPLNVSIGLGTTAVNAANQVRSRIVPITVSGTPGSTVTVTGGAATTPTVTNLTSQPPMALDTELNLGANTLSATASDPFGQRVTTSLSVGRLRTPVFIVPGYLGSLPPTALETLAFAREIGFPADELQINPEAYGDLVQSFISGGYTEGTDLFTVPYDWRVPIAATDGTNDGVLSNVTAQTLIQTGNDFALNYLGQAIAGVVENDPTVTEIDLVGHSNGTLMSRSFVQSLAPGGTFQANGQPYTMPKVDRLMLLEPPHEGASLAFNPWNGNAILLSEWPSTPTLTDFREALALGYDLVAAGLLTIQGPNFTIDKASITDLATGQPSTVMFVQQYFPSLISLNPTYDFLYNLDGVLTNVNNDPAQANALALDLNGASTPSHNPWLDKVRSAFNMYGVTATTDSQDATHVGPGGLYVAVNNPGAPTPTVAGQIWYEDLALANYGDGTVPLSSLMSTFAGDPRIIMMAWGNGVPTPELPFTPTTGAITHTPILSNPDVLAWIMQQFT